MSDERERERDGTKCLTRESGGGERERERADTKCQRERES